jgi:hypothetical protein
LSDEKYYSSYRDYLLKAFLYISRDPIISRGCKEIAESSIRIYSRLDSSRPSSSWGFEINPPWIIHVKEDDYFDKFGASLVIGGRIVVRNSSFDEYNSYASIIRNYWSTGTSGTAYSSCCEANSKDSSRMVRRFHFDTGVGKQSILETKSHMQFGGICDEEEAIAKHDGKKLHYCLDHKLKIPRLPYPPIDIVILFDLLIRQFNTVIDKEFAEKKEWIELVRTSEDFRLRKYYDKIGSYYEGKRTKQRIRTLFEAMCEEDFCF